MEAVGIAVNALQLFEYFAKVWKATNEIVRSGQTRTVGVLQQLTSDIADCTASLDSQLSKAALPLSASGRHEQAIVKLSQESNVFAEELLRLLRPLTNDSDVKSIARSLRKALRTRWNDQRITILRQILAEYQNAISFRMKMMDFESKQRLPLGNAQASTHNGNEASKYMSMCVNDPSFDLNQALHNTEQRLLELSQIVQSNHSDVRDIRDMVLEMRNEFSQLTNVSRTLNPPVESSGLRISHRKLFRSSASFYCLTERLQIMRLAERAKTPIRCTKLDNAGYQLARSRFTQPTERRGRPIIVNRDVKKVCRAARRSINATNRSDERCVVVRDCLCNLDIQYRRSKPSIVKRRHVFRPRKELQDLPAYGNPSASSTLSNAGDKVVSKSGHGGVSQNVKGLISSMSSFVLSFCGGGCDDISEHRENASREADSPSSGDDPVASSHVSNARQAIISKRASQQDLVDSESTFSPQDGGVDDRGLLRAGWTSSSTDIVDDFTGDVPIDPTQTPKSIGQAMNAQETSARDIGKSENAISFNRSGLRRAQRHTNEDVSANSIATDTSQGGPYIGPWHVPPLGPRRRPVPAVQARVRRASRVTSVLSDGASQDDRDWQPDGKIRTCIRRRFVKAQCEFDHDDLSETCRSCCRAFKPAPYHNSFDTYGIMDASLFREQTGPWHEWTTRWSTMDICDIVGWASSTPVNINITNCFEKTSYQLEVRQFLPVDGDRLYKSWIDPDEGTERHHDIAPYAITDMGGAAMALRQHVDNNIAKYVVGFVGESDRLIWDTFAAAFYWSDNAPTLVERSLILDILRLWVVSRMASHPESICDTDAIGPVVTDFSSPYCNMRPLPPVMSAQLEVIMYSTLLRPLRERILSRMEALLTYKEHSNWLTIYFAMFVLLHNCSLTTRRDEEFGGQLKIQSRFANPESIAEHHKGIVLMLAHFHCHGRGQLLASLIKSSISMDEFAKAAELPQRRVQFMEHSAKMVRDRREYFRDIRSKNDYANDYYFVSQLFDDPWQPSPIVI